jgi:hypothetical protein
MEKFDYKKVLVSGNEYECACTKNGRVSLFYNENGIKHMYSFDDTMHNGFLSKVSYFVSHEQMLILEVVSIDFINLKTGYTHFTGRIKFGKVLSTESIEEDKKI